MSELAPLISDLALILICAGVMTLVFKRLKQPLVLGYIVAGFLASPHFGLTPSVIDTHSIHTWSEIGVIFLLFALGLEFSFKKLMKVGGTAVIAACSIIFCMILIGMMVGWSFRWKSMDCLYLGGMLAMSSTTIIYKAFDDLGLRQQRFAGLVLSILIIEDILAIVLMVLLSTVAVSQNFEGGEMVYSIGKLIFFLILWFVVGIYLIPIFLKRSKNDKKKGIRDAWLYGASIVVIYVILGLAVTLIFGASALNALSTNAVFNILFFLMLVVFAASFFGAFEITLPASWSNAVDSKAENTTGLLSIFLMAFTLTLVSFSCTGPIIGFLLVEVSTSGNIIGPAIGMLGFAIALALPFTLFAMFPSWLKSMPKSGNWMNVIKVTLGFLELAFALKFLSVADLAYGWHILDRETFLSLWIMIFALLGFYLLGKIKFPHDEEEDDKVGVTRFFLALISLAFAVYMVPGLWGAPLRAISAFAPPATTQDFVLNKDEMKTHFLDYEEGMAYAKKAGKPVLLDFTGHGCVNCRKMENAVWIDQNVKQIIDNDYVLISLYVDEKAPLSEHITVMENGKERTLRTVGDKWSYLQRIKFGANAQPFYVLVDNEGMPLNQSYSYDENVNKYIDFLKTGLKNYKK